VGPCTASDFETNHSHTPMNEGIFEVIMRRRRFLRTAAGALAGLSTAACRGSTPSLTRGFRPTDLDDFIRSRMAEDHIPGLAAAILDRRGIVWESGYGWADLRARTPMTIDTLQNIASISKTFTTTAVMQVRDAGLLDLDRDINEYLGFSVVNPNHPDVAITPRHLLTHVSSLRDGTAYSRLYACGDPTISLTDWVREYFTPGGAYYSAEENFHPWAAGEGFLYCNTSYGLLGHLVGEVSGIPFDEFCRRQIFGPLGMNRTDWFLSRIDVSAHAVPYTWVDAGGARGPSWGGLPLGAIAGDSPHTVDADHGTYHANCAYNHPNFPDGFLRTSVRQLASYAGAYLNGGSFAGSRILAHSTVDEMLTPQHIVDGRRQGLTWVSFRQFGGDWAWGHSGGDPGVNTHLGLLPAQGLGVVVFANTHGARPVEIANRLLDESLKL
jgi:CubicO group peptidase (beta-lactamase class C family)